MIAQNPPPELGGSDFGEGLKQVLKKCLVKDPRKRSTASALLKMSFIKGAGAPKDTLAGMISETMTIMDTKMKKDGTLASVGEASDPVEQSSGAASDTVVVADAATVVEPLDFDTMVIAEDGGGAAAATTEQPAFMKRFIEMQAALAAEEDKCAAYVALDMSGLRCANADFPLIVGRMVPRPRRC